MKIKSKKSLTKRFTASHPKKGTPKIMHASPSFAHYMGKKRKFRAFRGKHIKSLQNTQQAKQVLKAIS